MTTAYWPNITITTSAYSTTSNATITYSDGAYGYDLGWQIVESPKYVCPKCNKEYFSKPKVCKKCGANDRELL